MTPDELRTEFAGLHRDHGPGCGGNPCTCGAQEHNDRVAATLERIVYFIEARSALGPKYVEIQLFDPDLLRKIEESVREHRPASLTIEGADYTVFTTRKNGEGRWIACALPAS